MKKTPLNFGIVQRQILLSYRRMENEGELLEWPLNEVIMLFRVFYGKYKKKFARDHPRLSSDSIREIIRALPSFEDLEGNVIAVPSAAGYAEMIDLYLDEEDLNSAVYRCNYSLAHFVSGLVRGFRYYDLKEGACIK